MADKRPTLSGESALGEQQPNVFETGLDRREPFIRKLLESDMPVFPARQPLGFRAESHQPPPGNREIRSLERAPNRLATDLDEPVAELVAVPIEAPCDLFEILQLTGHLLFAKEDRVA